MDSITRELVAVGATVTANCIPCLNFHYDKAVGAGATVDEIKAAIDVGRMVRRGAAQSWDKEADNLIGAAQEDTI